MRPLRSQRGATLMEVAATAALLAVVILAVTTVLQSSSSASRRNEDMAQAVMTARTVMEEIKLHLKNESSIFLHGQEINLNRMRSAGSDLQEIFAPSDGSQFRIIIRSGEPEEAYAVNGTFRSIGAYFRKITVTVIHLQSGLDYTLEAYAEIQ